MSQQLPLSQQLKALEQLQELDLKIDQLKKNKNALPHTLKGLDTSLLKVSSAANVKNGAVNEFEKAQRQTRAALELGRDRLTRSNSRLEGVRNTQEFQAINKEIDQLKKMNASLEEQIKKSDQDVDTVRKEQDQAKSELEKLQKEREAQAHLLSTEGDKLQEEISRLTDERAQFTVQVDRKTLAIYDRIRVVKNGFGMVPADGGRCKGCNMVVPPQLYNQICRGSEIYCCPSCHRILFAPIAKS